MHRVTERAQRREGAPSRTQAGPAHTHTAAEEYGGMHTPGCATGTKPRQHVMIEEMGRAPFDQRGLPMVSSSRSHVGAAAETGRACNTTMSRCLDVGPVEVFGEHVHSVAVARALSKHAPNSRPGVPSPLSVSESARIPSPNACRPGIAAIGTHTLCHVHVRAEGDYVG